MGRRVEKRRQTFRRVAAIAGELFAAKGYDATTIEEIALRAGVSPGTVYNYFGTKGAILMAVVAEHSAADTGAAVAALDVGRRSPIDVVMAVVTSYIDPLLELDRSMIAEVFAATFQPSRSVLMAEFAAMDRRVIDHLVAVFDALKANGSIGSQVDPRRAANIVFSLQAMAIIVYVADHTMARGDVEPHIRQHVELAFRGIGA